MNAMSDYTAFSRAPTHRPLQWWTRRILLGLVVLCLVLGGAGATYQVIADHNANSTYPPPGQLVDVGGYRLHLNCLGQGSPTVILDTGGGGFGSLDFTHIQPGLAKTTRVCAYDRAGYGWSDPSPQPRTSEEIVKELHMLLDRAGVKGPYVLGGMSLGGYFTRLYATRHPDEVVGMVLIDASHEDEWLNQEYLDGLTQFTTLVKISQWGARVGLFRLGGATGLFRYPVLDYAPAEIARLGQPTTYRTNYYDMVYAEINPTRMQQNADQIRAARRPLGNLPLVVMWAGADYSSEATKDFWFEKQRDMLTLSTNSKAILVEGANHITIAGPPYAGDVIEAMREMVELLRAER
jgi:pimeloyl-ACP methyl ester carboxylesterase